MVAGQRAQHAPQSLVQAGSLMIDTGKSWRAGCVMLWLSFCGIHIRPLPSGQENLTTGDSEGYSKVRRNGSDLQHLTVATPKTR